MAKLQGSLLIEKIGLGGTLKPNFRSFWSEMGKTKFLLKD